MNEKDSKAIHDLLLEWGTLGGVDGFRQSVLRYIAAVRQEARAATAREFKALYDPIFTIASTGDSKHPVKGQIDYDAKAVFDSTLEAAAGSAPRDEGED